MDTEPLGTELRGKHLRVGSFFIGLLVLFGIGAIVTALVFHFQGPPRIVFMSDRDGNNELYVMDIDGSGVENITNHEDQDGLPGWSGKENAIAFLTTRDSTSASIYRMDADGKELLALVKDKPIIGTPPEWSPNGNWIAFDSGLSGQSDIFLINIITSEVQNLTDHPSANRFSDWSPDSKQILFISTRGDQLTNNPAIFVLTLDDAEIKQISDSDSASALAEWSPDGMKVAFASDRDGDVELYVMDSDGENISRLTDSPGFDGFPAWSPDGTKIAFVTFRDDNPEIYVMNSDGSEQRNLTNNPEQDAVNGDFSWSPDGSQILFTTSRDGNLEIYVMDADGGNPTNLTNNPASDRSPTWIK
jgi:Tol biopolymer transport system component